MNILILNGPNLNLLGRRTPSMYGNVSMETILLDLQRTYPDVYLHYEQTNHEGTLIDLLQQAAVEPQYDGVILNAGGYAHTSVALRDAMEYLKEQDVPLVEVHISDIYAREDFRRIDLLAPVAAHTIVGHGTQGYKEALAWILSSKHKD